MSAVPDDSLAGAGALGLTNLGNSCYINAVIQSLFMSDSFRHSLLSLSLSPLEQKQHPALRALQSLFGLMIYSRESEHNPKNFHSVLPAPFNQGTQQDADEFAKYLLDSVSSQLESVRKQRAGLKRKAAEISDSHTAANSNTTADNDSEMNDNRAVATIVPSTSSGSLNGGESRNHGSEQKRPVKSILIPTTLTAALIGKDSSTTTALTVSATSATVAPSQPLSPTPTPTLPTPPSQVAAAPLSVHPPVPELLPSPLPSPADDVDEFFGGVFCSTIECLRCGHQSSKKEAFLDFPLPLQSFDDDDEVLLLDRIQKAREEAQRPLENKTVDSEEDVEMTSEKSTSSEPTPAPAPSSTQTTRQLMASSLLSTAESMRAKSESSSLHLPADVISRIAQFASAGSHHDLTRAFESCRHFKSQQPQPQAIVPAAAQPVPASATTAQPMEDSWTIANQSNSQSLVTGARTVPAVAASSPAAWLSSWLVQTTVDASLFALITTMTNAAAVVNKVQQTLTDYQRQTQLSVDVKEKENKSTALVLYQPPVATATAGEDSAMVDAAPFPAASVSPSTALVPASTAPPVTHSTSSSASSSPLSLPSLLRSYFAPELLTGSDRYHCAHCNGKQNALKTLSLTQPPKHLLVCLKRNEYDPVTQSRRKLMREVKVPAVVSVSVGDSGSAKYVLYSAVIHSGASADRGHYYTIARHSEHARLMVSNASDNDSESVARGGDWYLLNDSSVSGVSFSHLAQLTKRRSEDLPYLLFYRRFDPTDSDSDTENLLSLPVNPILRRLSELEALSAIKRKEREAKTALAKLIQSALPVVAPYEPPAADWVDPDM